MILNKEYQCTDVDANTDPRYVFPVKNKQKTGNGTYNAKLDLDKMSMSDIFRACDVLSKFTPNIAGV